MDPVAERASTWTRAALATSRVTGAPPLGLLLGLQRVRRTGADLELRFDPRRPAATDVGLLDTAVLADLALGGALRARHGAGRSLPTVSLTLHLARRRFPPDIRVRAWADPVVDGLADARGELVSGDALLGRALATFAVPDRAERRPALPWEAGPDVVPGPVDLTPDERALARDLEAVRARDGRSWAEELLAHACRRPVSEDPALTCRPTPVLRNRAGDLQGGVLFGIAAAAAGDAAAAASRVVSGHIVFAKRATAGSPVRAAPTAIRETRRTRFVRADVQQAGEIVATATFTLRPAG
jgi:acyl-coenzyme A thioesterase PaaI-like protein